MALKRERCMAVRTDTSHGEGACGGRGSFWRDAIITDAFSSFKSVISSVKVISWDIPTFSYRIAQAASGLTDAMAA